jgi:hypothetical protein
VFGVDLPSVFVANPLRGALPPMEWTKPLPGPSIKSSPSVESDSRSTVRTAGASSTLVWGGSATGIDKISSGTYLVLERSTTF